jgi:hypothetical protein
LIVREFLRPQTPGVLKTPGVWLLTRIVTPIEGNASTLVYIAYCAVLFDMEQAEKTPRAIVLMSYIPPLSPLKQSLCAHRQCDQQPG